MNFLEFTKENIVFIDGGMGTLLQARGLQPGELPETWNIAHAGDLIDIHRTYFDAGANIATTNTFGANNLKYSSDELKEYIFAAVANCRKAMELTTNKSEKYVALDIGPIGKLLKPYGDLPFETAVCIYAETVKIGTEAGADLILIETMNDSLDAKAALLAAKENSDLPVWVSCAYGADGKLMTGASPAAIVAMLEGMGADAVGVNCSLGPKQLKPIVEEYLEYASVPVFVQPNAGLPRSENGRTVYDVFPEEFAADVAEFVKLGVSFVGGCCGTTPDYIRATVNSCCDLEKLPVIEKNRTLISSYTHAVEFKDSPILIGERINPTGKKRFKEALREHDINYILSQGLDQQEKGVHVLDVNVGLPEIDEVAMLSEVVYELQAIIDLPLQIDTTNVEAMEKALRSYNGKAMINSVNGKEECMETIFPLVKKYGGLCVCLTLDENGIPETAEERVAIADRIISRAAEYGIKKKDLIFDTLAMTISADTKAALATLASLRTIRRELGCHTSLGVSNVSFGLPCRDVVTAAFFTLAMENGLSAAIMNPNSAEMQKAYFAFRALHNLDANCGDYITNIDKYISAAPVAGTAAAAGAGASTSGNAQGGTAKDSEDMSPLKRAVIKGLKEEAGRIAAERLVSEEPLLLVNSDIIPALDVVGKGFEAKTMYLPQLLMSAEAAQAAFEKIKEKMSENSSESVSKGKFVIATVKGDIHDIGKNIVKLILENYGFTVYDLGKDVPADVIVDKVIETQAPLLGLSALMTTTVPAMEETIRLCREKAPWVRVVVGGAVLTKEYADMIGADAYSPDAMATVRYAEEIVAALN